MVYGKTTFEVGKKVTVLNYEDLTRRRTWKTYEGEVVKIGRAYVHVMLPGQWLLKFEFETGLCDGRYMVFPSRNDYIDFHNTYLLRQKVQRAWNKQYKTLPVKDLLKIAEVLHVEYEVKE